MPGRIEQNARRVCGCNEEMLALYMDLAAACGLKDDAGENIVKLISVGDYVRLEMQKGLLCADIEKRGIAWPETNGRQRYTKENRSMAMLLKVIEQQRKICKALGLNAPDGEDAAEDSADADDFDVL